MTKAVQMIMLLRMMMMRMMTMRMMTMRMMMMTMVKMTTMMTDYLSNDANNQENGGAAEETDCRRGVDLI